MNKKMTLPLVRDIVKILSEKCGLAEGEVRERYEEVSCQSEYTLLNIMTLHINISIFSFSSSTLRERLVRRSISGL